MSIAANKITINEAVLSLVLLAYPALALTVKGGMNTAFAVIALASIYLIATSVIPFRVMMADRTARIFALAMSSGALGIMVNQLYYQEFFPNPFDSELRFVLAILIFMALRQANARIFTLLEYAFPLGVLAALLYTQITFTGHGRLRTEFLNSIHVGGIALVLGFLSLYSINWLRKDALPTLALKLTGFAAGIYMVIQSGTRGAWLALPFLLFIGFATMKNKIISIKAAVALIVVLCIAAYSFVDIIHLRTSIAFKQVVAYASDKTSGATGSRLDLWKASFHLLKENPIIGIKPGSIDSALTELRDAGVISEQALYVGKAEMHSEVAARLAKYGLMGLIAVLAVSLVPGWLFYRALRTSEPRAVGAARMGLCVVTAFFIFGLTLENYNIKMVAAFYSLTVAVLLSAAMPKESVRTE